MSIGLTYTELKALSPCEESMRRVMKLMGGARKWGGQAISAQAARDAGATFDDIVWAASALARDNKDVERRLRLWMADCAARVLHIYEKQNPQDMRVREAIVAARQFARGEIDAAARAAARAAAWGAARDAAGAAWDAAWAAAGAAARDASWDAARAAAWDAARAAARAAAGAAARDAARADEEQWQFDRLIARFSDDEPSDYPLPETQALGETA